MQGMRNTHNAIIMVNIFLAMFLLLNKLLLAVFSVSYFPVYK